MINHYIISSIFTIFATLFLSIFVFVKNHKTNISIIFALSTISISVWNFCFLRMITASNEINALFWARGLHLGAILIPVLFFHFAAAFLGYSKSFKKIIGILYLFTFLLLSLTYTNFFISKVSAKAGFKYFVEPGPLYHVFTFLFLGSVFYTLYLLYSSYTKSSGLQKIQTKYIFFAYLIGYSGGCMSFFPLFNIFMPPFALYSIPVCMGIIAYTIIKYHLMDISLIARNIAVYLIYFTVTIIVFVPFIILPIILWGRDMIILSLFFIMILIIAAPMLYQLLNYDSRKVYIKNFIDWIDQSLFNGRYNYLNKLKNFWDKANVVYTSSQLAWTVMPALAELMNLKSCSFFIYKRDTKCFVPIAQIGLDEILGSEESILINTMQINAPIPLCLIKEKKIIRYDDLNNNNEEDKKNTASCMNEIQSQITVPLFVNGSLIAILNLGNKKNGDMFYSQDIELLNNLIVTAEKHLSHTVFLENSIFHSGNLAHDIRSPLKEGVIYSYIDDIRQSLENNCNFDQAKKSLLLMESRFEKFHSMIDMMVNIYDNLKRFVLSEFKPQKINYTELVKAIVDSYHLYANERGIIIEVEIADNISCVYAEPMDVERILNELIINAFKYTDKGTIKIEVDQQLQNEILTSVIDSGTGISEDKLETIFEPFASLNTEYKKGIGIGLASIRQLLDVNGGKIWVKSEKGIGSSFYFTLPAE